MLTNITDYLKNNGWVYSEKSKHNLIFSINGNNGIYHCAVDYSETELLFAFITYMGIRCPSDKTIEILELINSINTTLLYSNFEMSKSGHIKCRTCICFEDITLTEKVIDNIILRNINNIDVAAPFFTKYMFGNISQQEVVKALFPFLEAPASETQEISE